jgi:hypothetical protein
MKKSILLLAMLVVSSTTFSQVTFKPGARAGINLANVSETEGDTKTDFYIGGLLEMQFSSFYALQPEVVYSRQGAKSKFSGVDDLELQYVGLSIANKFSPFKDIGLHFIVGPGIDIKVGDNVDYLETAAVDFVFFGGIGYELPFGLSVEARFKQGILDVDDGFTEFGGNGYADDNNLNGVFQIGVAYKFDFSK